MMAGKPERSDARDAALRATLPHVIQRGWTLALTPGGVDQDLQRLGHHRIQRPMFPFDRFETAPDLTPRLFG